MWLIMADFIDTCMADFIDLYLYGRLPKLPLEHAFEVYVIYYITRKPVSSRHLSKLSFNLLGPDRASIWLLV